MPIKYDGEVTKMVEVNLQLEIIPGRKVVIPGCEPTSAMSSDTLARAERCGGALADVDAALEAIPGSFVKYGMNFARGGMRQGWLVLPPLDLSCPCVTHDDYYNILRELADNDEPVTESFDACNVAGQGFCPSPGFELTPAPQASPYVSEGTAFGGLVRVLP